MSTYLHVSVWWRLPRAVQDQKADIRTERSQGAPSTVVDHPALLAVMRRGAAALAQHSVWRVSSGGGWCEPTSGPTTDHTLVLRLGPSLP